MTTARQIRLTILVSAIIIPLTISCSLFAQLAGHLLAEQPALPPVEILEDRPG